MNQTFKIAKAHIPVDEEVRVEIEGLEISVENLDLRDYVMLMKEVPSILREVISIVKEAEEVPTTHSFMEEMDHECSCEKEDVPDWKEALRRELDVEDTDAV